MKLFLASDTKHPDCIQKLEEYSGGLKGKDVAYIPTARNANGWQSWKDSSAWTSMNLLGMNIDIIQLEEFGEANAVERLRNKDIIWVGGGYAAYLMYWMIRCEIDRYLPEILDSETLYIGSSAGSMITTKNLEFCEWYFGEGELGAGNIPGLGLVDFEFWPHYDESHDEIIKENYKGEKMYLVKDGEAIIVEDGKVRVIGEERIIQNTNLIVE